MNRQDMNSVAALMDSYSTSPVSDPTTMITLELKTGYRPSPIMQYFKYEHLPDKLKAVSESICKLAEEMDKSLPHGPEKTTGLRKLLEAKDCFVRHAVSQ